MNSLQPAMEKLENLFETFNARFYDGKLPKPIITISPDTTTGAYGWCTAWKAWEDSEGNSDPESGYYEINLCAEYLARPLTDTAGPLLHEMAHLYNLANGVKDCSRGGTYHNRRFKEAAESHGLTVEATEKYGWNRTALNPETADFVSKLSIKGFDIQRKKITKAAKTGAGKKQSSRKYVCPCCGLIVRATKPVNIICGDCQETMVTEE